MALRPYQVEAVDAIVGGLAAGGRGQLHAACGSGKTRMSIEAATRLVPDSGLLVVLVPSLSLAAQTITEWRSLARVDAVLAVCSDDTVTDSPAHLGDVPAETTTDPDAIAAWLLEHTGRRLVVATYLSAPRLADALRDACVAADLVVHDEAHHLTGRPDFMTRQILDDKVLLAQRRLFMTATPRVEELRSELSRDLLTMSDTAVFGPVLYSYPWARAISDGHLDDYRIVVIGVSRQEVLRLLEDEDHDYVDQPGSPNLRVLAAQVVLVQAARQHQLKRVIAFCHRLDAAATFSRTLPEALQRVPARHRPAGAVHSQRITGEHTHAQRAAILDTLREPPGGAGAWTVLTNVRCLSEGVDVPAVDGVLFTHPKRSQVDIVQAVGRALRPSPQSSGVATVIVPIVVPDSAEEISDLEPGEYNVLWQVIRALRAHDESLGIELDRQRSHLSTSNPDLPGRITVQLPAGTSTEAMTALKALTVRQTTSRWWEGYGQARAYAAARGSLDVPSGHVTEDGFDLGRWIVNSRQHRRKGWLSSERVAMLDALGMIWNTQNAAWETFLAELRAFHAEHGHVLVPQNYATAGGYPLGIRINTSRSRAARVPEVVRQVLDDLGMVWDTRDLRWQEFHTRCQQYADEHGHLNVPKTYVTADGYTLGARMATRLRKWRAGTLDPAERESLQELGVTPPTGETRAWTRFLDACDRYVSEHGSLSKVRKDYVDSDGYKLGGRISYYRNLHAGTVAGGSGIPEQRRAALDERGMTWRIAPARDITADEADALRSLPRGEQPSEILRLVDGGVTQTSISEALGMHRSYLNVKIKALRETGQWPARGKHTPDGLT